MFGTRNRTTRRVDGAARPSRWVAAAVAVATGAALSLTGAWPGSATTGWTPAAPLPISWAGSTNVVLADGDVLLIGGGTSPAGSWSYLTTVMRYDFSTGTWGYAAPLPEVRNGGAAALLEDGRVLYAGGQVGAELADSSSAIMYDPVADAWESAGSMSTPRNSMIATRLADGRVIVVGGNDRISGCCTARGETDIFDPATGTWSQGGDLAEPRWDHTMTLVPDGRVVLTGGLAGDVMSSVEIFDPETDTWSAGPPMTQPRHAHAATLLQDGRVLAIGTYWGGDASSAEAYDPVADTWTPVAPMLGPRAYHQVVTLPDGGVLVAGGHAGGEFFASTERYDPVADVWASAGDMTVPRNVHAMALLPDGRVLVAGGTTSFAWVTTDSVDIYGGGGPQPWPFGGFTSPVDGPPTVNTVKAGAGVPVKFSVGGDRGLGIFATGSPSSVRVSCDTSATLDAIEQTVTAGQSGLTYNPDSQTYTYVWKTAKSWAGTCRMLDLTFSDGTSHTALFKFK